MGQGQVVGPRTPTGCPGRCPSTGTGTWRQPLGPTGVLTRTLLQTSLLVLGSRLVKFSQAVLLDYLEDSLLQKFSSTVF